MRTFVYIKTPFEKPHIDGAFQFVQTTYFGQAWYNLVNFIGKWLDTNERRLIIKCIEGETRMDFYSENNIAIERDLHESIYRQRRINC